jgi:tRNA-Thr(GGU) m(6)t(6)A37 methyltransferase TsaA
LKKNQKDLKIKPLQLAPIGFVKRTGEKTYIELLPRYRRALEGLKGFSRIIVLWWCDRNDSPGKRRRLKVHPMGDKVNPLQGIFATRSPVRPNPIALSVCSLLDIEGTVLTLDQIDAFDQTPVLDIKPCAEKDEEEAVGRRLG